MLGQETENVRQRQDQGTWGATDVTGRTYSINFNDIHTWHQFAAQFICSSQFLKTIQGESIEIRDGKLHQVIRTWTGPEQDLNRTWQGYIKAIQSDLKRFKVSTTLALSKAVHATRDVFAPFRRFPGEHIGNAVEWHVFSRFFWVEWHCPCNAKLRSSRLVPFGPWVVATWKLIRRFPVGSRCSGKNMETHHGPGRIFRVKLSPPHGPGFKHLQTTSVQSLKSCIGNYILLLNQYSSMLKMWEGRLHFPSPCLKWITSAQSLAAKQRLATSCCPTSCCQMGIDLTNDPGALQARWCENSWHCMTLRLRHSLTFTDIHWHSLTFTDIHWHSLTFTPSTLCIFTHSL